jgi:hypothetical protein
MRLEQFLERVAFAMPVAGIRSKGGRRRRLGKEDKTGFDGESDVASNRYDDGGWNIKGNGGDGFEWEEVSVQNARLRWDLNYVP